MTLHWWMHWFWVTLLIAIASSATIIAAPQSEELQHLTTDIHPDSWTERQGRALYFSKPQSTIKPTTIPTTKPVNTPTDNTLNLPTNETTSKDTDLEDTNLQVLPKEANNANITKNANETEMDTVHPSIQWTPVLTDTTNASNPLLEIENVTLNATNKPEVNEVQNTTKKRNLTKPEYVKENIDNVDGVSESRIVTEKPLSLETAFVQTRIPSNKEYRRLAENNGGMDTGAIAGICFAALVCLALAGSTAFVLYRRRYLNKPQTLNDKCSNPDSSGYLDDSTIRDNSEEMYSLDNDSFLNSLEAMTIQNYWTDTVKHTKL